MSNPSVITGKRLFSKLAGCPLDALPHGVSHDGNGYVIDDDLPIDKQANYLVIDNVRNRDVESVDTIDSDWSVGATP